MRCQHMSRFPRGTDEVNGIVSIIAKCAITNHSDTGYQNSHCCFLFNFFCKSTLTKNDIAISRGRAVMLLFHLLRDSLFGDFIECTRSCQWDNFRIQRIRKVISNYCSPPPPYILLQSYIKIDFFSRKFLTQHPIVTLWNVVIIYMVRT